MPRLTRECTIQELGPDYSAAFEKLLAAGEQALVCFESWSKAGGNTQMLNAVVLQRRDNQDYHMAYVVTPAQLAVVGSDYWPSDFARALPIADIVTVERSQLGGSGFVVIATGPGRRRITCRFSGGEQADRFASVLRGAMAAKV